MSKSIYLAGPITGLTFDDADEWRIQARTELAKHGIDGLSPLRGKSYLRMLGELSPECVKEGSAGILSTPRAIMTRDFYDATTCDVLLVNLLGATHISTGTVMELAWAYQKRTPTVVIMEPASGLHILPGNLAWLAALIDGEGSVYIVRPKRKDGISYEFRIQVTMTDKRMIDAAYQKSGCLGSITGPYARKNKPNYRLAWRWTVHNQQAALLARALHPYLVQKKDAAACGAEIELINSTLRQSGNIRLRTRSPEIAARQADLYALWERAQNLESLGIPLTLPPGNVHEHAMLNEAIGFRVSTLEEGLAVCVAILNPNVGADASLSK